MPAVEWTIQLRTNFADRDKNEEAKKVVLQAARHLQALALLLHDGIEPDIAVFNDDWFAGKKEINILEDVIQQGIDQTPGEGDAAISSELLAAAMDSKGEKK